MKKYFMLSIFMLFFILPSSALASTYYISPTGNDSNSGASESVPIATFSKAWQILHAGDTLKLMDGVYNQSIKPTISGSSNPAINTSDYNTYPLDDPQRIKNFIKISAVNDGKAIIDGQNQREPVVFESYMGGSYFLLEGLIARNSSGMVYFIKTKNVIIRRCSGYNAETTGNNHVFAIWTGANGTPADPSNILVEDCIAGGSGRKMFFAYTSYVNVIFRRLFAAATGWRGGSFCPNNWPWEDGIEIYNYQQPNVSNNSIVENSIIYGKVANYGFSLSPNPARTIGNKYLGDMAIKAGMNWDGTPTTWPCVEGGFSPYDPSCSCTLFTQWPSERAGFVIGTYGRPYYKDNVFQDLFAWSNAGVGIAAGQPTQPGGWCDGTEGVGAYPCAKCNKTESSRTDNCSACVYGDTATPRDQCPAGDYTNSEKSSNNVLNRISVANNGLGTPIPQEGRGTNITSFTLSQFDSFGSKSNLFIDGKTGFTDKTKGARLRYRYVNGVLKDGSDSTPAQELWPWPMEERIKRELADSSMMGSNTVTNFSVTNTIVPLLNQYTAEPIPSGTITPSPTSVPCALKQFGDTDCNNIINMIDLSYVFGKYGGSDSKADLDSSGKVNMIDLSILIKNFGRTQ